MSEQAIIPENPFVGLRPYESDEGLLFFGRKKQTSELLQRLHRNHFVAIVGSSGSGKSSLIRAGLIPALNAGFLVEKRFKWKIAIMKPGESPLFNLAKAIYSSIHSGFTEEEISQHYVDIREQGVDAILDLFKEKIDEETNFFLLIDQFEEIFRFLRNNDIIDKSDQANEFVNLILKLADQKSIPIYVVMTMRSDFLGDCVRFQGLPESLNKSQYLVPRLNRQALREVIESPVRLYGAKINPRLTDHLLNHIDHDQDELPILQHLLMRIWEYEHLIDKSGDLDLADYHGVNGFERALSDHADEAFDELNKEEQQTVQWIFQRLTDVDEGKRKVRRATRISELKAITGKSEQEISRLLYVFMKDHRSFLVFIDQDETKDFFIDITHEALIRHWKKLEQWVEEEEHEGNNYRILVESYHRKRRVTLKERKSISSSLQFSKKHTKSWSTRYFPAKDYSPSRKHLQNSIGRAWFEVLGVLAILIISGFFIYGFAKEAKNAQLEADKAKQLAIEANQVADLERTKRQAAERNQRIAETENDSLSLIRKKEAQRIAGNEEAVDSLLQLQYSILLEFDRLEAIYQDSLTRLRAEPLLKNTLPEPVETSIALKSMSATDPQLKGLLAIESYLSLKEKSGSITSDRFVFNALQEALIAVYSTDLERNRYAVPGQTMVRIQKNAPSKNGLVQFINQSELILTDNEHIQYIDLANLNHSYITHDFGSDKLVINPDGNLLLNTAPGKKLGIFSMTKSRISGTRTDYPNQEINDLIFHPNGESFFFASNELGVIFRNQQKELQKFLSDKPIYHIAFNDESKLLVGNTDTHIVFWKINNSNPIGFHPVISGLGTINALKFSPDGLFLAVGSDSGMKLLDLRGESINTIYTYDKYSIKALDFSQDGRYLIGGGSKGKLMLWNLSQNNKNVSIEIQNSGYQIRSVSFAPDNKTLVAMWSNGITWIMSLDMMDYAKGICEGLTRDLTRDEWKSYFGSERYRRTCIELYE